LHPRYNIIYIMITITLRQHAHNIIVSDIAFASPL
jgi:hypothetical protein